MEFIVLWVNGGRLTSVKLCDHNRDIVERLFLGSRFQTDASGTEHWNVHRAPTDKEIKGLNWEK